MPSNLQTVLAFIDLWAIPDLDRIIDALAPDCRYHNMPWEPLIGHTAIRDGLAAFIGTSDAIDWRVFHAAESADGTVMTERLDRFRVGGKWIEIPVMGIFELADGKITHWRDYFDAAIFQSQMDALTPA
ncbi:limonene-1,2-epoxide hydrolase family protein [Rhizorhabdus argentea]|uniref:limonene-1,2-epoxide hydrolase family protein n=1 Tax=Rhizorhabdus argentea TaxID=1387174 RepID=UPI0030EC73CA